MTVDLSEADTTVSRGTEPQPRQLIVTLFGLYARGERNWLSVASVVRMMDHIGVDGPSVRSSISRLKRRNVLLSARHDGVAGYSLSQSVLDVVNEGDSRIFGRRRATLDDNFLVLVFSVPESERDKRHALRVALTKLGFGTVAPGVWIAPAHTEREAREALERRGLSGYVEMFDGRHIAFGDLRSKIRQWWDLDELSALYSDFITTHRPVLRRAREGQLSDQAAFTEYVPMLTTWRRLPYLDPGLPIALLPHGWNGVLAEDLFADLNEALGGPAREHALKLIHQ
ncbi:PaaX family transcriptional regulator C-terminal domain-containing protein [Nocardia sp. XZ_19_385]|uniref:PaaX family transcriptional regulator n=1 Tax=Nocardia sp. XZ_19_385 TaxID=2769488 RepID=UPI00188FA5F7|nr:PaaX family transcriptional regulator C-terminal domain-containing protein [Nocardia sp. XZ_19_385]